jgi:hypothetical protein
MHCVILVLISALFGMFVSAILVDQVQAIVTDETAIEQVQNKGPYRPHKPRMKLLSEVFGREHPFTVTQKKLRKNERYLRKTRLFSCQVQYAPNWQSSRSYF